LDYQPLLLWKGKHVKHLNIYIGRNTWYIWYLCIFSVNSMVGHTKQNSYYVWDEWTLIWWRNTKIVSNLKINIDFSTHFPTYCHRLSTPATGCQLLPPGVNFCHWVSTPASRCQPSCSQQLYLPIYLKTNICNIIWLINQLMHIHRISH